MNRCVLIGVRFGLLASLLLCGPLRAAELVLRRDVQAVFILNLTRFIHWPDAAFATSDAPLTIGVLANDPVGAVLAEATRGEKAGRHPIVVREIRASPDLEGCQLVYFAKDDSAQAAQWLSLIKSKPVLAVGETDGFIGQGGHIQFYSRRGQMRLRIELGHLADSALVPSAQLLRVADLVKN